MDHGIWVKNASGVLIFSSTETFGGVFAGTVSALTDESKTVYLDGGSGRPDVRGKICRVVEVNPGSHNWGITQGATPYIEFVTRKLTALPPLDRGVTVLRVFAV